MDRDLIAGGACPPNAPLVYCPPVEPTAYDFNIVGQSVEDFFGLGPTLLLGTDAALVPQPTSLDLMIELAMPLGPISSPPSLDEVPTSWQTVAEFQADPAQAVGLPLPFSSIPFGAGAPFWLRLSVTDEKGCVTRVVIALPTGLPETWEDATTVWFSMDGAAFLELDVPADGVESDPIPFEDYVGECPPPAGALAVAPACDFPVQVTETTFRQQPVTYQQVNADSSANIDGATSVVIRRVDDFSPGGTAGTAMLHADPVSTVFHLVYGQEVRLDAAPGGYLERIVVETVGAAVVQIIQVGVPT